MSTIAMKHFDKLTFVDNAKKTGFNEEQARFMAENLEQITEVHASELEKELTNVATKADIKDVEINIKNLELRINEKIDKSTNKLIAIVTFVIAVATFILKFH